MEDIELKHFYANNASITIGLYDCQFTFKLTTPDLKEDIEKIFVHASPMHAKAIYTILKKNIEAYEEKFGTLDLPKEVLDKFEMTAEKNE